MLTRGDIQGILSQVECRDFQFQLMSKGDGFLLQVTALRPDSFEEGSGLKLQKGRKWYVSAHSAHSEVVQTILAACARFELHELYEDFRYRGQPIFSPHLDVNTLSDLMCTGLDMSPPELGFDCREDE
jgi:hypothetical protein